MKEKSLLLILKSSVNDLCRNVILAILGLIMAVFLFLLSKLSVILNYKLQTTFLLSSWLVLFILVSIGVLSFFFSGLIGICALIISGKKTGFKDFLRNSNKFWLRNFVIILIIGAAGFLIGRAAHYLALYIGKGIGLELKAAQILFFLLYLAGLIGLLIFLTFSSFYLILYNYSMKDSIKKSTKLVKVEYSNTICILLLFFVIYGILHLINYENIRLLIESLLIIPYFALVLTRFVLEFGER